MTDRTPPHDLAAEQAVLGAMLLSAEARQDVCEILTGADFYRLAHEWIFRAVVTQDESGDPVDPITVAARLAALGQLEQVGGPLGLHDLVSTVTVAANASHYARIVRDTAIRRSITDRALKAAQLAHDESLPAIDLAERARGLFDEAAPVSMTASPYADLVDVVIDEMQHGSSRGQQTPWCELTELIGGWQADRLYVIAARPSVGKSLAAQTIAADIAAGGQDVLFSALEMSRLELTRRALAATARVNLSDIIRGSLSDTDWDRVAKAADRVKSQTVFINDDGTQTVSAIRSHARSLARRGRLGMVVIDHLGLVTPEDHRVPRPQQVGAITRGLKRLAKELHVPVVALSQLNRGSEGGGTKVDRRRPTLIDLRDSGDIEQDADVVMFLHQPDPSAHDIDGLVSKNRDGPLGIVPMVRMGHHATLRSRAR